MRGLNKHWSSAIYFAGNRNNFAPFNSTVRHFKAMGESIYVVLSTSYAHYWRGLLHFCIVLEPHYSICRRYLWRIRPFSSSLTIFSLNLFLNYNMHIPKKSKIVVVFLVIEVMNTKALKKNVSK